MFGDLSSFGHVRVRGRHVGVLVRVWGWSDERLARHDELLEQIIDYVVSAFHCGLLAEEMVDDLIAEHGFLFEDADIDIDEQDEVNVMLVPIED